MKNRKRVAGVAALSLAAGASAVALAANSAAVPRSITIKEKAGLKMVPNRYLRDGLRWNKDVYTVKSGGTVTVVNNASNEGPHTLSVVRKSELPRNARQMNNCAACRELGAAHGANPSGNTPPKYQFLENGVGASSPPNLDRPGDSGVTGPGNKNEKITFGVGAKKGTNLYFLCLIHPWMQAELRVR